jgi:hypothetical protein
MRSTLMKAARSPRRAQGGSVLEIIEREKITVRFQTATGFDQPER